MINKIDIMKVETGITRLDPDTIQVNAWIGDLNLGQRNYRGTTVKKALRMATDYIRINGSLH